MWQKQVAPFKSMHGYGPSPLIYRSLVIVPADNPGPNYLAALRRDTGEVVWRIHRMDYQSFASPNVGRLAGRDQLVVMGPKEVSSYDPINGQRIWYATGPTLEHAATAVFGDQTVYASAGYPDKRLYAIRADGSGDVTATHILWKRMKDGSFVPTPLWHAGLLYVVNDRGLALCLDAKTGDEVWSQRLEGGFSASPVLVGDKLFVPNEAGKMFVLQTGREFKLLAENDLQDGGFASPVICGSRIYECEPEEGKFAPQSEPMLNLVNTIRLYKDAGTDVVLNTSILATRSPRRTVRCSSRGPSMSGIPKEAQDSVHTRPHLRHPDSQSR